MWPFSNAKAEMLEARVVSLAQALSRTAIKRDILAVQVRTQQQEIDNLKAELEAASKNDARNSKGRYTKTTDV